MPQRLGEFFRGDPSKKEEIGKPKKHKNSREMLFLAEQAAEGGMKVLPGKEWSFHYPINHEAREEKLKGLMSGKYTPDQVAKDLKPDALIYNIHDLESQGLEAVSARVLDATAQATQTDYYRYAQFITEMKGLDIDLPAVDNLYNGIHKNRIQKKLRDSYGMTGQRQMDSVLQQDAQYALSHFGSLSRTDKVLSALKLDWLCEDFNFVSTDERDQSVGQLSGDERALFNKLKEPFRKFVHQGDETAYRELTSEVKQGLPVIQRPHEEGKPSKSMQELDKELEQFKDQATPPGSPEDPAIPPEDEDEYHTPESHPGESKEKRRVRPIFEIKPPLAGYYASGRKSYYDVDTKTWSKKKQLQQYRESISNADHTISGVINAGLKSLPLPNGYAFDAATLKTAGAYAELFRDQNGCFYIKTAGDTKFSIDFGKEDELFIGPPIPQDTAPLYTGTLSEKTEKQIQRSAGSAVQKAKQVQAYILASHFYPGGGDLEKAGALQAKLRQQSTGDNYLQNIDASEYLECYSSNTLGVAMVRKLGVPARLVVGHSVEGAVDGKSQITESTGHAWAEVWDNQKWVRIDFTPPAKPEDKKKDPQAENQQKDPAEKADDGGTESPQKEQSGESQEGSDQKSDQSSQGQKQAEASDSEVSQAEQQLQEAEQQMKQMSQAKDELNKKVEDSKNFKDLEQLQKELEQADLLDDMKKDLEEKLEAKEDQMKEAIKEQLDKMVDDGFMDEQEREKLEKLLEEKELKELDKIKEQIERDNKLYNEYDDIREEVRPLVDQWLEYFMERLPRQQEVMVDEDSRTRQGSFDRKSIQKPRNLIFGTVKNPRVIESSIKPLFLASIMLDVSGSMEGQKLNNARKLLVFYSELFTQISEQFGYLRFSVNIFSDTLREIKTFDQDYDSASNYSFSDGSKTTVKVRLMQGLKARGGTNMLEPIKRAAADLSQQSEDYPDFASAFYFVGDGEDTSGNSANVKKFLEINDSVRGFGDHMRSAIMLGGQSERQALANIFGDEHTTVAADLGELIEQSMLKFDEDIEEYLKMKTI